MNLIIIVHIKLGAENPREATLHTITELHHSHGLPTAALGLAMWYTLPDLLTLKSLKREHSFMLREWNSGARSPTEGESEGPPPKKRKKDCKWCNQSYSGAIFVNFFFFNFFFICFESGAYSGFFGAVGSCALPLTSYLSILPA